MLASRYIPATGSAGGQRPTLIFLHGLLGSGEDWQSVLTQLSEYPRLTIDLPGHGDSVRASCVDFADCCQQIDAVIRERVSPDTVVVLIGYSLGARILMYGLGHGLWSPPLVKAAIIEGGNFGLTSDTARQARWCHDERWANRFARQPLATVLADWYQQPVFASLTECQRQALVAIRSHNVGMHVAKMMMATSLAKQPSLLDRLQQQPVPVLYVCGEKDDKFRQLAENSGLLLSCIRHAGHNAHKEQPAEYARHIRLFLSNSFESVV